MDTGFTGLEGLLHVSAQLLLLPGTTGVSYGLLGRHTHGCVEAGCGSCSDAPIRDNDMFALGLDSNVMLCVKLSLSRAWTRNRCTLCRTKIDLY